MSTVAEIIEAVKEWPETEKGVLFRERDPLREPEASRGSLARMRVFRRHPGGRGINCRRFLAMAAEAGTIASL
ncbi:MAG: hypothetical protein NTV08_18765 [Verrucomicrobia bacterium]|nr:hypothetical protein [Verrucomicrobiota bacterium]